MFTSDQFWSIVKGAVIAALGAALAAVEHSVSGLEIGPIITPTLTAINSVIVNAVRKYFFG